MIVMTVIVWIVALIGMYVMYKIEPWNWFYPIYAFFIALCVTAYTVITSVW